MDCTYLPYSQTGYFSNLVNDYLDASADLQPYYTYRPDAQGIEASIQARGNTNVDRQTLVEVLKQQYEGLEASEKVIANIELLADEKTFTICTAHQPNLLTGYLYFVYKIVHAIKLADELKTQHPEYNFVPVYYMGSEDNDLDELGTFRYAGKKFVWDAAGQQGAVGRMDTKSLKPLLGELFKLLGPPGENLNALKDILAKAYLEHATIASATQYLVNELFGRFGLIVLNPDEAAFKKAFIDVMRDDLLNHKPYEVLSSPAGKLGDVYKTQAYARPINLFYLHDNLRERIEKNGNRWQVLNTDISFDEEQLEQELAQHPERFSPNVILRGLFQETILPNVVFIGGGAEVAYWLQLKPIFQQYHVFYPVVMLRQSVLWADERQQKARKYLGLSVADIFKNDIKLSTQFVTEHSEDDWQTTEETKSIKNILAQLQNKATEIDPTLNASAEAVMKKISYQLQVLEKKMLKAEKRKMQHVLDKVTTLKKSLFPNNSLQERVDNFMDYYLQFGNSYFDVLYNSIQPVKNEFLVMEGKEA